MTLFRPEALRRAQSPEGLDALLQVTSPGTWLALTGLGLLLALLVGWAVLGEVPVQVRGAGLLLPAGGLVAVTAPEAGVVAAVDTAPGEALAPGDPVAVLSAGAGRATSGVPAVAGGRVAQVLVQPGVQVGAGQVLAWVEPGGEPLVASVFLPLAAVSQVQPGQAVEVEPDTVPATVAGYIEGRLASIAAYPATQAEIAGALGDAGLAASLVGAGDVVAAQVTLRADPSEPGGLRWSDGGGAAPVVGAGTPVQVMVVVATFHPLRWVFGGA